METAPVKVSILIPVYNTAAYLPACMKSVQNQTLREIEIIAVNDASPDNAAEVLAGYAAGDPRVRVITHEKNGGILAARLSGIAAARGEYLIFLDADDTLDLDTARAAYAKAKATGADMIHYEFDVRLGNGKKTPFARDVQRKLEPYRGTLLGRDVFEGAFVKNLYRWNICGKMISLDVCRKAAAALPPGYYIMAEDLCFFTMLSFFSTHYEPLFKKCYNYVLNIGVSAYTLMDFKGFIQSCSVFTALNSVRSFLESQHVFEQYRPAFEIQEQYILGDLMDRWENKLVNSHKIAGFNYMMSHYSPCALLNAMIFIFHTFERTVMEYSDGAEIWKQTRPVHRIAVYLEHVAESDFAAAMLKNISAWIKSGYEVVLVTPESGVSVPVGCAVTAPPFGLRACGKERMMERVRFWRRLAQEQKVDTVVHGETADDVTLWEMMAVRFSGMNFIAAPKFYYNTLVDDTLGGFVCRARVFAHASAVAALSSADCAWWKLVAPRSCCVELPGTRLERRSPDSRRILWLGEYGDPLQCHDVLSAWRKVLNQIPDAVLVLPDGQVSCAGQKEIHTLLDSLNLRGGVRFESHFDALNPLLDSCAAVVRTGADDVYPLAVNTIRLSGVPEIRHSGESVETLFERLTSFFRTPAATVPEVESAPCADGWKTLFDAVALPGTRPDGESRALVDDLLRGMASCRTHYEPYCIEPPPQGDCFVPLYRILDRLTAKFFPPESPRRHFVFRAGRALVKRLTKN